jgi:putative MATE family efflux protein
MTEGIISKQLLMYALPLLAGELFQQFYNIVDAMILGNYVSPQAMAAVGATSSITKMLVGFFNGISIGCTVIVARHFGAGESENLKISIHTIVYMMAALGVFLGVAGFLITSPILKLLSTPPEILTMATDYVKVYFLGLPGLIMYNTFTGILRAVGDSRRPFYFLLFSSALNILLDFLLAVFWGWGVIGVAMATVLSQAFSALLCLRVLTNTQEVYRFRFREARIHPEIIRQVFKQGVPTGLQKTLTSFSNVIVLSYINFFGESCLAGWVIYTRICDFLIVAMQSIGSSVTTFVSQNLGAQQYRRARDGIRFACRSSLLFTTAASVSIFCFRASLARLFGNDPQVLCYADLFIGHLILLQAVQTVLCIYAGALRGMGFASAATLIMLVGLIGARQLYLSVITRFIRTPVLTGLAFPVGWLVSGLLLYIFYRKKQKNIC